MKEEATFSEESRRYQIGFFCGRLNWNNWDSYENGTDPDCIDKSEFVTDAGRQLHQGMWGGATNCNKIIKHQFGIEE